MCRTFAISCQIKNFRFTLSLRGGQQAMMMRVSPYRTTYDKNGDSYKVVKWAILPAAILAILFHRRSGKLFLDVGGLRRS